MSQDSYVGSYVVGSYPLEIFLDWEFLWQFCCFGPVCVAHVLQAKEILAFIFYKFFGHEVFCVLQTKQILAFI